MDPGWGISDVSLLAVQISSIVEQQDLAIDQRSSSFSTLRKISDGFLSFSDATVLLRIETTFCTA